MATKVCSTMMRFLHHGRLEALTVATSQWLAGLCFGAIVVLVATQVFCRYVLNNPLPWPEELASMLFISMTYLGALVLPERRLHISVDFFYGLLPKVGRRALDLLSDLLAVAFFGVVVYGGLVMIDMLSLQRMPALQIPRNTIFAVVTTLAALQVYIHASYIARTILSTDDSHEARGEARALE